jgi:hypothetical protein
MKNNMAQAGEIVNKDISRASYSLCVLSPSQQPQTWPTRELVWLNTPDSTFNNILHLVITFLHEQYYNDSGLIHVLTSNIRALVNRSGSCWP